MGNSRDNPGWLVAVSVSKKGESSMKLLCCADLHNSFDLTHFETQTYDKEPDLIVTLGDISVQDLRIIKRTADNLGIPAIGICGNHDEPFALQSVGIDDLHGKVKTIDGVTFAGIGGSLRYKRSNYMFLTQQQSIDIA